MTLQMVTCPLCCQPGFSTSDALCSALVSASTRKLHCPVCNEVLIGLDKLTIHLFGHNLTHKHAVQSASDPQVDKSTNSDVKRAPMRNPIVTNPVWCFQSESGQLFAVATSSVLNQFGAITINNQNYISNTSCESGGNNGEARREQKTEFTSCKDLLASGDFSVGVEEEASIQRDDPPKAEEQPRPPCAETKPTTDDSPSNSQTFICDECELKFSNKVILAVHKQLTHKSRDSDVAEDGPKCGDKPRKKALNCNWCSATFNLKSSLLIHIKVTHPAQKDNVDHQRKDLEKVNCQICSKTFPKESSLQQHMKSAHGEKPWQCSVCAKAFTTKYFLRKHKRIHTGETPYECGICHKVFTFQQSYHKHMLYHTDDKPYCCSHCGRLFKELSTLNNHERIHSGEKPFACETCGKSFRQRVSYLVHRRIHTGVMPYKCTACNRSFRYKISQRTHKCLEQPPGVVIKTKSSLIDRLQAVINKEEEKLQQQASLNKDPIAHSCPDFAPKIDHCGDQKTDGLDINRSSGSKVNSEINGFTECPTTDCFLPANDSVSCNGADYDNMDLDNNSPSLHNLKFNEMIFGTDSCGQTTDEPEVIPSLTNFDSSPSEFLGRLHISSSDYYQTMPSEQKSPSLPDSYYSHPNLTFDNLEDDDLCNLLFRTS